MLALAALSPTTCLAHSPTVRWEPAHPRIGDVVWLTVRGVAHEATVEGSIEGRPLRFFPYADGHAAVVGFDVDTKPGPQAWRLAILAPVGVPQTVTGRLPLQRREFNVQRLTLPDRLVDLDPETEQRAVSEAERLRTLYATVSPERLWRGRFLPPVWIGKEGSGFGARRIINGRPRAPHTGADYAAPLGTPVVAVNDGRVALVANYFFPGRLAVLDHGLGLYTLYFHLDEITVLEGERVGRGQSIGTVGATGRATGPHLHFGVQVGGARVDPATLLALTVRD